MSGRARYLEGLRKLKPAWGRFCQLCNGLCGTSSSFWHLVPFVLSQSWGWRSPWCLQELNLQVEQRSPLLVWDDTERFEFLTTSETPLCRKNTIFNLLLDRKEIDGTLSLRGLFLEEFILLYFTGKLICSLGSWVEDRHCLAVACLIIPCNFDWQWNMHWKAAGSVCQLV